MMQAMRLPLLLIVLVSLAAIACARADRAEQPAPGLPGSPGLEDSSGGFGIVPSGERRPARATPAPAPAAPPAPAQPAQPAAPRPAPPAPAPTPAPQAPTASDRDLSSGGYGITEELARSLGLTGQDQTERDVALVAQQRIIVRTVNMDLVVRGVADSMERVASLAQELGGWVVSSDRSARHEGSMSIRVPAASLDAALLRLRELAVEVRSEVSTSQDVTDEYVDTTARVRNLEATEAALIRLLERAQRVEEALNVQRELTRIQEEIERLQGRIKFLEETAAFSLINIRLRIAPVPIEVDAGADQTYAVGQPVRFQASFQPPEGIDSFNFTWDFGDGSQPVVSTRTAPTVQPGTRVTSVVTHQYFDDQSSPFIATVKITGTGDAGLAEGEDTVIITVTRIPTIEVFPGEGKVVEAGQRVDFSGSFTRPEGLTDLTYTWDFGDGSAPATGALPEGVTRATASHVYSDHRPMPYTATLTISGVSEAGKAEASSSIGVWVREPQGWVIQGWSFEENGKVAVRALSGFGLGLATALMWLAIFSPVWVIGGAVLYAIIRRANIRRPAVPRRSTGQDS